MPKKPIKWDIKVWVCSESVTGYIHKFQVYTDKDTECTNGLAYGVAMHLLEDLQDRGVGKTLIGGAQSETTHRVVSNLYNNL